MKHFNNARISVLLNFSKFGIIINCMTVHQPHMQLLYCEPHFRYIRVIMCSDGSTM